MVQVAHEDVETSKEFSALIIIYVKPNNRGISLGLSFTIQSDSLLKSWAAKTYPFLRA